MIEAHAIDAWTRAPDRATTAFRDATILGGMAAPLFLWLSGTALALSAAGAARRRGRAAAVDTVCRRGLELFVLAFLFRLQAFVHTPGSPPLMLLRVDILNIMGPAIAVAGLVWGLSARPPVLAFVYGAIAASVALLTPIVRTAEVIGRFPAWMQWYIRPAGELTTFTAFPWAGFVFAGAAVGVLIAASDGQAAEARLHDRLARAGLALVALGFLTASLPSIYRQSSFWTSSPTYFAIRVGLLMTLLAMLYALGRLWRPGNSVLRPLARVGRRSLFVYWIHVELVYGYATWPMHGRLPLWGTAVAYVMFVALMYAAVVLRDEMAARWRRRGGRQPPMHLQPWSASGRTREA